MTAPTLQAEGNIAAVTNGNLAITLPTYAANDIVVLTTVGWVPNTTTGTATQTLASPWTKYTGNLGAEIFTGSPIDGEWALFWARATSASSLGTTVTITRPTGWDTGANDTCWAGRAYVIRGCNTTGNPYEALNDSVTTAGGSLYSTANGQMPTATVNGGDRTVIQFFLSSDDLSAGAAQGSYVAGTAATSTTGTDAGFQTFRIVQASSTISATNSAASAPAQGFYCFISFTFTPVPAKHIVIT